jgi:hypothetical protein
MIARYCWLPFPLIIFFLSACIPFGNNHISEVQTIVPPNTQEPAAVITTADPGTPEPDASVNLAGSRSDPGSTCPLSMPPDPPYIPPDPYPQPTPGDNFWYGRDSLWTAVPQDATWANLPKNPEGYTQKVFWWRRGYSWTEEAEPQLAVSGRRIDAPAPPLQASKATNAYAGDIGPAMLVGVDFPTTGCWEITGRYADAELSFVVWVGPGEASLPSGRNPDADAIRLVAMSEQARQIVRNETPNPVLRQVDTDLKVTDFQFVDKTLTKVVTVVVPQPDAPNGAWHTTVSKVSPLLSYAEPALDLQDLRTGPERVAHAITAHWPGCTLRGITLYQEKDRLTWTAFCNTPEGVASRNMDGQTGIFQPSAAPLAPLPSMATPSS